MIKIANNLLPLLTKISADDIGASLPAQPLRLEDLPQTITPNYNPDLNSYNYKKYQNWMSMTPEQQRDELQKEHSRSLMGSLGNPLAYQSINKYMPTPEQLEQQRAEVERRLDRRAYPNQISTQAANSTAPAVSTPFPIDTPTREQLLSGEKLKGTVYSP